jgi:hypothetical protein
LAFSELCDCAAGGGGEELGDCAKAAVTTAALSAVDIINFFSIRVSSSIMECSIKHNAQLWFTVPGRWNAIVCF